jgi:hypothetical protein
VHVCTSSRSTDHTYTRPRAYVRRRENPNDNTPNEGLGMETRVEYIDVDSEIKVGVAKRDQSPSVHPSAGCADHA